MDSDPRVLFLSLAAQWASHYQDEHNPNPWWLSPRQITAIAGQFNAPTNSENDPIARLVQSALIFVLLCAIYRANLTKSQLFPRKYLNTPEIAESRASVDFSCFFWVFSVCQMIRPPTY